MIVSRILMDLNELSFAPSERLKYFSDVSSNFD